MALERERRSVGFEKEARVGEEKRRSEREVRVGLKGLGISVDGEVGMGGKGLGGKEGKEGGGEGGKERVVEQVMEKVMEKKVATPSLALMGVSMLGSTFPSSRSSSLCRY